MRAENLSRLATVRDQVLDRAEIQPGETVLDVGTGQGLLGLGALDRTGPNGRVIFSDVSEPALDDCRSAVEGLAALARSSFVLASATALSGIGSDWSTLSSNGPCSCSSRIARRRSPNIIASFAPGVACPSPNRSTAG